LVAYWEFELAASKAALLVGTMADLKAVYLEHHLEQQKAGATVHWTVGLMVVMLVEMSVL